MSGGESMKKILILFLLVIMLSPALAAGECKHENVQVLVSKVLAPEPEGHLLMEESKYICLECRTKISEQQSNHYAGHVFWMAENLHFSEDELHMCIFICEECMYVYCYEYDCDGGRQCNIYRAPKGVVPKVQELENAAAWKEENTKEMIIRRWLAQGYI